MVQHWIAHRGNTQGPQPQRENHPDYIDEALKAGFHAEIDVWYFPEATQLYLGHDAPQYPIPPLYLHERKAFLWCHAKNLAALTYLLEHAIITFWHDIDHYTLTSNNLIWAYPGYPVNPISIIVMPERTPKHYKVGDFKAAHGVCSDYVESYKKKLLEATDGMELDPTPSST